MITGDRKDKDGKPYRTISSANPPALVTFPKKETRKTIPTKYSNILAITNFGCDCGTSFDSTINVFFIEKDTKKCFAKIQKNDTKKMR